MAGASLGLIWWSMRGTMSRRTRLTIGLLWAFIGLGDIVVGGGAYDRLIGSVVLLSAYVALMPFLPCRRRPVTDT
jgi:hypothetical protein